MKCPQCGATTHVLATRGKSTRRRRECANGHRFNTEETQVSELGELRASQMRLARLRALLTEELK